MANFKMGSHTVFTQTDDNRPVYGSGVPAGTTINTTYGTNSTQSQLSSTGTYVDAVSVTATRKQSSSTMMVRGVLPVYWYTG